MTIDPLLPLIMAGRPLAMNNALRAKVIADTPINARDLEATRRHIAAAALEQIEFAQAEAVARARHAADAPEALPPPRAAVALEQKD